jgi:hypothetical protein
MVYTFSLPLCHGLASFAATRHSTTAKFRIAWPGVLEIVCPRILDIDARGWGYEALTVLRSRTVARNCNTAPAEGQSSPNGGFLI